MATLTDTPLLIPDADDVADSYEMGFDDNGRLMTVEEFIAHDDWDDNYRYELVHGVLIVNPPPGNWVIDPNEELSHVIRSYAEQNPGVIDWTLGEQFLVKGDSVRRADRVVWTGLKRQPIPFRDVPTIVIEIVSAGKRSRIRDYITKRDEYMQMGVREYWVIDRFQRKLTVFRRSDSGDAPSAAGFETIIVPETENYTTPLLPGFELPLGRLIQLGNVWEGSPTQPPRKQSPE